MAQGSNPIYYRNRTSTDTTTYQQQSGLICCTIETTGFTNPGYKFVEWNSNRTGTGTSYYPGDSLAEGLTIYAIWAVANDITVTKNTASGSERWDIQYTADQAGTIDKTLLTAGKLMDRNEKVSITIPSGSVTAPAAITGEATAGAAGTLAMANPQIRLVELTQNVLVTPNITTAGFISSGTAGTSTIKTYAQIAGVLNNTFTPTTTDQLIASNGTGFYLVGVAKVAGDANLVAGNIKKDVPIFGVTGTYEGAAELPPANGEDF